MDTNILIMVLGGAVVVLAIWIIILEMRLRKFMIGKNASSLEDVVGDLLDANKQFIEFRGNTEDAIRLLDERIKKKLHGVKILRFNPFQGSGQGGNQSFAAAFLDEDGNGVVLSTLHSREKVSIFAKPVAKRSSEFELTDEERAVLE